MKLRRKILSIILLLVMAFSLPACSSGNKSSTNTTDTQKDSASGTVEEDVEITFAF